MFHFHLLKNSVYFFLLVLKGIYHYWKYVYFFFSGDLSKWRFRTEDLVWEVYLSHDLQEREREKALLDPLLRRNMKSQTDLWSSP